MPAAAVIPAPVAYAKVVAVEKLVAEVWGWMAGSALCTFLLPECVPAISFSSFRTDECLRALVFCFARFVCSKRESRSSGSFTVKKLECSKQATFYALNISAWDDETGLCVYFQLVSRRRRNDEWEQLGEFVFYSQR